MQTLRVGLLLDGTRMQRWQIWCVEQLLARGEISIELAICNRTPAHGPTGTRKQLQRLSQLPSRLHELPWILLNRADRRFAQRDRSGFGAMIEEVDLAALPVDVPVLDVVPRSSASGLFHRFDAADVRTIERYGLDLLLRFGFNILQGDILHAAHHGVWSFHHADNRINRGGPPGFWEVARAEPVTGVIVQRLNDQLDNGEVLAQGWYSTDPISWNRNFHRALAQSRTLLTDAIGQLARTGQPPERPPVPVNIYAHRLYRKPSAPAAMRAAALCYGRRARNKTRKKLTRPQWHLRWGEADIRGFSAHRLDRITPPTDRFWADPFPYTTDGRTWLFVEELLYATGRGRIVALEVSGNEVVHHTVALECPYHLSYPFLFERDGVLYMIPETAGNGTIELWRCRAFPDQWEKVRDFAHGIRAVDSTLLEHDGLFYLFTNIAREPAADPSTELHILISTDPIDGEWRAHPKNPVIVDSRCARMAGGFIHGDGGSLVRCAQYTGTRYGEAIALRLVEKLTPEHYTETGIGHITPTWEPGLLASHHLAGHGGMVALDACSSTARWRSTRGARTFTECATAHAPDSRVGRALSQPDGPI